MLDRIVRVGCAVLLVFVVLIVALIVAVSCDQLASATAKAQDAQ